MDIENLPFTVYDFFAYLSSGFLFLAAVDFVVEQQLILSQDTDVVSGFFWILISYITGQILASPSSWLLEREIVGKFLNTPSVNLFSERPKTWRTKLFPGYFTPLPETTQKRIQEKAEIYGITEIGEPLFIHAFGQVKSNESYIARLNIFLNMYGFSRNISFTCLISAVVISVGSLKEGTWDTLPWVFLAIIGSIGMFYRYLKFFRQYSYELFISYAELVKEETAYEN